MPRTGAFDAVVIWYRLEAPPGACALVLAPSHAMTRYQIPSLASNPGQRYHLLFQHPLLMSHQYRLQQQLVPLVWTFGPFSSSVSFQCVFAMFTTLLIIMSMHDAPVDFRGVGLHRIRKVTRIRHILLCPNKECNSGYAPGCHIVQIHARIASFVGMEGACI